MDNVLHNNNINKIKANGKGEMTQSDTGFTTWSQLKKSSDHIHIQRYDVLSFIYRFIVFLKLKVNNYEDLHEKNSLFTFFSFEFFLNVNFF